MTRAATLVRDARRKAGMTQAQLGHAANVTQSVISAYESGRRDPSFEQLDRLISATGNRLVVEVAPRESGRLEIVRSHAADLRAALEPLGARRIRIFGSVARRTERPDSDVDLLVDLDDNVGLFALLKMQSAAERILGGKADIVPSRGLKPDTRDSILSDAVDI